MHERLRVAGPVVRLTHDDIFGCARHAEVTAVVGNPAHFISSAGVGLSNFNTETLFRPRSLILEPDAPQHDAPRAVLSRILSPKAVMQIRARFTAVAERVFPDAVGVGPDGRENLLVYGDLIFNSMGPRNALLARSAARTGPVTDWIMAHCQRNHLAPGGGAVVFVGRHRHHHQRPGMA